MRQRSHRVHFIDLHPLESRTLFAATIVTPVADLSVPVDSPAGTIDLSNNYNDPASVDQAARLNFAYGNKTGSVLLHLFNSRTPLTVANFLKYINSGEYNNTFFHRLVTGFVLQGGGYILPESGAPTHIDTSLTNPPLQNEPGISNTAGTLAMAKQANDPNSATSEFFFNLGDNSSNLDNQNGGFTVFASVADGMNVIDDIVGNAQVVNAGSPFDTLPTFNLDPNATAITNANLVVLASAAPANPVVLSVSSDNPTLVTPSLNGRLLTLAYGPGASGVANVTVHVTAFDGSTVDDVFQVNVSGTTVPPPPAGPLPDLAINITAAPTAAVVGGVSKPLSTASAVISNHGNASSSPVRVAWYLSSDATFDNGDTPLSVSPSAVIPTLKPGKSKTLRVRYANPSGLPNGSYFLIARVDPDNVLAESDETNNTAASAAAYAISPPFVDLTGSIVSVRPSYAAGKAASVPLAVTNNGNVPAVGTASVSLFASTSSVFDPNTALPLTTTPVVEKLNLKNGKSKTLNLKFPFPTLAPGTYHIVAVITSNTPVAESDTTNNTAISAGTFTVT